MVRFLKLLVQRTEAAIMEFTFYVHFIPLNDLGGISCPLVQEYPCWFALQVSQISRS